MRWKIRQARPSTMNEALATVMEVEAFMVPERQRSRPTRAIQTKYGQVEENRLAANTDYGELRKEIEALK